MVEKFKTPEDAVIHFQNVRAVALGEMSHPTIKPEQAQMLYARYGRTIDAMIDMGKQFTSNREALMQQARAVEEASPGMMGRGTVNAGGKALAIFGSLGMVLTFGQVIGPGDIKEAWTGPAEMNRDMKEAQGRLQAAMATIDVHYGRVFEAHAQLASAILTGDEATMDRAYERLNERLTGFKHAYSALERSVEDVGLRTTYFDGAMGVVKDFAIQSAITVATMGATEVGIHFLSKAAGKFVPLAIAKLGESGVAGGVVAAIRTAPRVVGTAVRLERPAVAVGKTAKAGYELRHSAHGIEGRVEETAREADEAAKLAQLHAP